MKILLAEDNLDIQKTLFIILKSLGFNIDIANDGLEVLEKLTNQHYDLILMDIKMPGLNGLDTAKQISEQNINRPKIIIMTGHAISELKPDMAGIDGYLIKPFTITQLKNAFSELKIYYDEKINNN
jgi:CheY-like chemotaxis protein